MLTFRDLRLSSLAGLALALSLSPVLAQSGGSSAGGGAATGASSGTGASGMDAAGSGSRALRQQGTGGPRAGTPGTAAPNPALGPNAGQSAALLSEHRHEPVDLLGRWRRRLDAPQKGQSGASATNRGGSLDQGQPDSALRPLATGAAARQSHHRRLVATRGRGRSRHAELHGGLGRPHPHDQSPVAARVHQYAEQPARAMRSSR